MSTRFLKAIYYGASQMLVKWLKPPAELWCKFEDAENFESFSQREWRDAIAHVISTYGDNLGWLPTYKKKFDSEGRALAEELFYHFYSLRQRGGRFLLLDDEGYPQLLAQIQDPPLGLSVLGDASVLSKPMIAVVGSRKAVGHALRQSFEIGKGLACNGFSVVSGGAFGCDIAAHQGVLDTEIRPLPAVVVFAGGLKEFYPKANDYVFRQIHENKGVFLSERLWSKSARPVDFPTRNRLVSGLAAQTLIMQAHTKSGAMITAKIALDQGREVYVLVHPEDHLCADGTHSLLMDGALGFENAQSFVEKSFIGYRVIDDNDEKNFHHCRHLAFR